MPPSVAIGIDLGGTNLKGAAVDRQGRIVTRLAEETSRLGPDEGIAQIARLVQRLRSAPSSSLSGIVGVGIGTPGPLSHRTGRIIRSANMSSWVNVPIRDRLREMLGVDITLDNDGNAAAFGEFWAGAGRDGGDLVMLTLGTGVGGGVVLNGRVLRGHFENAAELGHMIVAADGLPCPCGQRGCLEQYTSASGVARRVVAAIKGGEPCALSERVTGGLPVDAELVVESARGGDPLCSRVFDEACQYLGIACVNIQHAFNPARIVFGGGMSRAGSLLIERVAEYARRRTWNLYNDLPEIMQGELAYDAGMVGAAGLAWQEHENA